MEPELQRRVQRYGWDRASTHYENSWQNQLRPAHDELMSMSQCKPGEQVLDIAAGTGLVSFRIAEAVGGAGKVLATDISDDMVNMGRSQAAGIGLKNIEFKRMGAEQLEVKNDSFDLVVCALGLMYVPELDKAFDEMYRVLKPGGRAACAVWGQRRNCGWADIFPIVDARVNTDVCPLFFQLGTGDLIKQYYEGSGFRDINLSRIETRLKYQDELQACEAAFLGGPVALAYSRFSEQTKNEAMQEYINSIAPFRTETGYEIPGEFLVAIGYKQ